MSKPDEFDTIAASLRRQFAPPSLEALEQRIADAAEQAERQEARDVPEVAVEAPATQPRGWTLGFAVAFAVAAAIVLLVVRPWQTTSPPVPSDAPVAKSPAEPVPPTASERAGAQLDGFLSRGDRLGDDEPCESPEPPEVCDGSTDYPHLVPDETLRQVGECGGNTGTFCSDFDLPADRALLVQLSPGGEHVIVCIEHPWTDPRPELPASSRRNIFRSTLGDYVIYEVTPLDHPRARDFLRL